MVASMPCAVYFLFFQTFRLVQTGAQGHAGADGEKKLPDSYIVIGHYVAWVVVSCSFSGWQE